MLGEYAMILAAGLGTRMGALSAHTPKPLTRVNEICLPDRLRVHSTAARIRKFEAQVHYLATQNDAAS